MEVERRGDERRRKDKKFRREEEMVEKIGRDEGVLKV